MTTPQTEAINDRATVQSIMRAVTLLNCFADKGTDLTLTSLARKAELTPSTAHRLIRTLVQAGFVEQNQATGRYAAGPALLSLARGVLEHAQFVGAVDILQTLAIQTGQSATLGVRTGDQISVLLHVDAQNPLRVTRTVGTKIPLHASAMGKALLLDEVTPIADRVNRLGSLQALTGKTITAPQKLIRNLEEARIRGYTISNEEEMLGLSSVGASISWTDGTTRAAIEVAGPSSALSGSTLEDTGRIVAVAAGAIQLHPRLEKVLVGDEP